MTDRNVELPFKQTTTIRKSMVSRKSE